MTLPTDFTVTTETDPCTAFIDAELDRWANLPIDRDAVRLLMRSCWVESRLRALDAHIASLDRIAESQR